MSYINAKLISLIKRYSDEWIEKNPAYMGNLSGVVSTGIAGIDWVRLTNGQEVKAINRTAPQIFDTKIIIGKGKTMPGIWQVISVREVYLNDPNAGFIAAHAPQHQYPNFDTLFSDRKQLLPLTVLVNQSEDFTVTVYGSVVKTKTQWALIETQDVDLTAHIPSVGYVYAVIEANNAGVLSVNVGDVASSLAIAGDVATYIPMPSSYDKFPLAAILLHEAMDGLIDNDIRVLFPLETSYTIDDTSFIGFLENITTIQEAFEALDNHTHDISANGRYRQMVYVVNEDGTVDLISADGEVVYILQDLEE